MCTPRWWRVRTARPKPAIVELAASLLGRADELKRRFNADFWVDTPGGGYFALGLDRDKRRIDGFGSNMGHCLWTGHRRRGEGAARRAGVALGADVQRLGVRTLVEAAPTATTRSRTTAVGCGRTTTRSARPG